MLTSFGDKGIIIGIIFFILEGVLFWFTTIAIENGWFGRAKAKFCKRLGRKRGYENQVITRTGIVSIFKSYLAKDFQEDYELSRYLPSVRKITILAKIRT